MKTLKKKSNKKNPLKTKLGVIVTLMVALAGISASAAETAAPAPAAQAQASKQVSPEDVAKNAAYCEYVYQYVCNPYGCAYQYVYVCY